MHSVAERGSPILGGSALKGCEVRRIGHALVIGNLALSFPLACLAAPTQQHLERAVHVLEQQAKSGKGEFINFLTGAASAYRWAEADGAGATYCPPPGTRLDGRGYARMTLDEYKRGKSDYAKIAAYPLDVLTLALLRSLRAKFPCPAAGSAVPAAAEEAPKE
jgi:hypothetical protein